MKFIALFLIQLLSITVSNNNIENKKPCFKIFIKELDYSVGTKNYFKDILLIDDSDIESYNWEENSIALNKNAADKLRNDLHISVFGTPLLVKSGDSVIYDGMFWTILSSFMPPEKVLFYLSENKDTIRIYNDSTQPDTVNIHNQKIYECLKSKGLVKE